MRTKNTLRTIVLLASSALFASCDSSQSHSDQQQTDVADFDGCEASLQAHLDAVSDHDLEALKSTLWPEGKMTLALPGSEVSYSTDEFLNMHEEWFKDTSWTFQTTIKSLNVDQHVAFALVEVMYREPDRNGAPYFNRMNVTYGLTNEDGQWYVIHDHACSVEKSQ